MPWIANNAGEEINSEYRAEGCARRRAEYIRRNKRIAEQTLECRAGDAQRSSNHHCGEHARPAHLQYDILNCRRRTGGVPGEFRHQHIKEIGEGDRIAAHGESERKSREENAKRDEQTRSGGASHDWKISVPSRQHTLDLRVVGRHVIEAAVEFARERANILGKLHWIENLCEPPQSGQPVDRRREIDPTER